MASKRRGGRASAKRARAAASARRRADERAGIDRRGAYLASGGSRADRIKSRTATGGTSTGRESGIAAANKYDRSKKEKSLQQSLGSLDRRVEKALEEGNTDLAKDLRSRQNKFAKELGLERAKNISGGTIQGNVRTSSGAPLLTTRGFDEFQRTVDQDFLDPTRKLRNLYPDDFAKMYPITNIISKPLGIRAIESALGIERKPTPYNLEEMPGIRYPLDIGFGAGEGEPKDPMNIADLSFIPETTFGPATNYEDPNIIMAGQEPETVPLPLIDIEFTGDERPLPDQFPVIDPNKRSEIVDETMGDIIDSGVQNFDELDKEFQEDQARIDRENALQQSLRNEAQMQKTAQILGSSGYNLNQDVINDLFGRGLLEEGTNYFPNPRIGTNPLIDEALQSYYQSLQQ
jgi:hypothetical protein